MTIDHHTVTGTETFAACNILHVGPAFVVQGGGNASLVAGNRVLLGNGVSVEGTGALTIRIETP